MRRCSTESLDEVIDVRVFFGRPRCDLNRVAQLVTILMLALW